MVCRGCKRFSHEIVDWNGYNADQQQRVWSRLSELRDESVRACVRVHDKNRWRRATEPITDLKPMAFAPLVLTVLRNVEQTPIEAGLKPVGLPHDALASDVLRSIDRDFYIRSTAYYERSFKTLAL